jgi:hypothetical protein
VLGAAGDVVPGSEADESEVDGEDADGSVTGGEDAGGDDPGGDEAGGDEAGGDDAGGEDFAGLLGLEDEDEDVDGCVENWDTIGVGARDVLEGRDRVGLRYMSGETRAADGADDDDAPGLAAGSDDAAAGEVATAPAPACGCR